MKTVTCEFFSVYAPIELKDYFLLTLYDRRFPVRPGSFDVRGITIKARNIHHGMGGIDVEVGKDRRKFHIKVRQYPHRRQRWSIPRLSTLKIGAIQIGTVSGGVQ